MSEDGRGRRGLLRLGTLPVAATLMTALMAAQLLLIAFTNWTDFGTNREFVRGVLEMDTTFQDPDVMWRAIGSRGIQDAAYVGIIVWESLAGLVLGWGFVRFLIAFRMRSGFDTARRIATVGFLMVVALFWGGFIVVGGEYFQMWQSDTFNGLQPALQNSLLAGLGLLVTHLPSRDWEERLSQPGRA